MGYVGNIPAEKYSSLTQQTFSSPTGTSFTLSQSVTNSVDIALFIDNVRQDPSSYTASGTALTTSTISSPSTMYCLYNGKTTETVSPPAGSVDSGNVVSGAIDDSHITGMAASKLTGVVAPANLGTGTASASTFLRGDGAYAAAGGGGLASQQVFTASGTWTKPTDIILIKVYVTAGGGGGSPNHLSNVPGCGGGAGGTAIEIIDVSSVSSVTVTIGISGPLSTGGGTSSFGAYCSATGGAGGATGNYAAQGAFSGVGTGGDINLKGGGGGTNTSYEASYLAAGGKGGESFWGGGAAAGGNGTSIVPNDADSAGFGCGGGGGGAESGNLASVGGAGIIVVEEYK